VANVKVASVKEHIPYLLMRILSRHEVITFLTKRQLSRRTVSIPFESILSCLSSCHIIEITSLKLSEGVAAWRERGELTFVHRRPAYRFLFIRR
jgi:hypothetical protein